MKRLYILLSLFFLGSLLYSQGSNDRLLLGSDWAKKYISENTVPPYEILPQGNDIISDSKIALDIAEIILDSIYGSDVIDREKPFEVFNYNGYWLIAGTLPKNLEGGTAVIILSQKDGRVLHLVHYK